MPQPDPPRVPSATSRSGFAQRVLVAVLVGAIVYALWRLADLVLLLFAAVLFAIGLRADAGCETVATFGYFLIGLHAFAALLRHYIVKDDTLRCMLPG